VKVDLFETLHCIARVVLKKEMCSFIDNKQIRTTNICEKQRKKIEEIQQVKENK
jgi:hypothetical protein